MKRILTYLFLIFTVSISAQAQNVLRWAADAESNAPYIFQNPKSPTQLMGFELEIAEALAKELGMTSKFVQNQWDGLIPGLGRNDYDIAINGLEITDDRKGEVLFSVPYYITNEQIVVRDNEDEINDFANLYGKRVGALKYSLAEKILQLNKGIIVVSYEGEVNAFEDLKNGRIDATLVDAPIALYYASWNTELKLVGHPVGKVSYGIALSLNNSILQSQINMAIGRLIQSGKIREILDRWNLWNQDMAAYTNDFSLAKSAPVKFDEYMAAQGKPLGYWQKIQRYLTYMPLLIDGALMTLQITIVSMLIAIILGLLIAITRVYAPKPISALAVMYIEIIRGTPLLIQLFFIFYALPSIGIKLSPFIAAVLGLGLNYAAYEAENYRAGLASVPPGQMEAALSLGMRRRQALRYVIVPQAFRLVIPPVTNDFISLLKDSSLVSVITMIELTKVYGQLASTYYDYIGTGIIVAGIYLLIGLPFVKLSKYFENRLSLRKYKS